jgi:hypothetical protein
MEETMTVADAQPETHPSPMRLADRKATAKRLRDTVPRGAHVGWRARRTFAFRPTDFTPISTIRGASAANGDITLARHLAPARRADRCNDAQRRGQQVATYMPDVSTGYGLASLAFSNGVGYFAGTASAEGYATGATTGTLLCEAVDKRGGTTAMAENTLNTSLASRGLSDFKDI